MIMKQLKLKSFMLGMMLLVTASASAYDFTVDGKYYNILDLQGSTCEITHGDEKYTGDIVIPEYVEYDGNILTVVSIGDSAFAGCDSLASVVIPNSVTLIGDYAFRRAYLESIEIPNSVTLIGDYAFSGARLESIEIPNSVTVIGCGVFSEAYLESIEIPNSVTVISRAAFSDAHLDSIEIPNSVTLIDDYAFSRARLDSIEIPNSVTVIGGYAFSEADLESIEIPNSVTLIYPNAFNGCTSLTSVVIGNSLKEISVAMFRDCDSLTSVEIGNSVTVIDELAFGNCTSLTNISIPNSVRDIGYDAFRNCTGLTSVEIGNSVTLIYPNAFNGCTSLTSVEFGNSVMSIDSNAFYGCTSLTNIEIPNSVYYIWDGAFYGCTGLKNLVFEDGSERLYVGHATSNGDVFVGSFEDCPIETLYLGRNLNYETGEGYGYSPFYGVTTLTDVTIGSMVTDVKSLYWRRYVDNLKTLQLQCATPPSVNDEGFDDYQYANLNVYVPEGSLDAYKADDVWKNFLNFWEGDPTGISGVEALGGHGVKVDSGNIVVDNATGRVSVYDAAGTLVKSVMPDGNRVEIAVPSRGVYIVRAGGKAVKVAL